MPGNQATAIIGGTGAQGIAVTREALSSGHTVQLLARSLPPSISHDNLVAIKGDLDDAESVERVLSGASRAIVTLPMVFDVELASTWLSTILKGAEKEKLELVVLNSSTIVPDTAVGVPAVDARVACERLAKKSSVATIITRPPIYMGNLLLPNIASGIVQGQTVAYPLAADVAARWVTWEDAAKAAVHASTRLDLAGQTVDIGGPESLTGEDIAESFANSLGGEFEFFSIPRDDFEAGLSAAINPAVGKGIADLYRWFNSEGKELLNVPENNDLGPVSERTKLSDWIGAQDWSGLAEMAHA